MLDRNPENFFAEIEQAAFSPANFVPGVEPSPDRLLQGRCSGANYDPNSRGGPEASPDGRSLPFEVRGAAESRTFVQRADDFEQAGLLYRLLSREDREHLISNIAGHLGQARATVQQGMIEHFTRADADYGARVKAALNKSRVPAR